MILWRGKPDLYQFQSATGAVLFIDVHIKEQERVGKQCGKQHSVRVHTKCRRSIAMRLRFVGAKYRFVVAVMGLGFMVSVARCLMVAAMVGPVVLGHLVSVVAAMIGSVLLSRLVSAVAAGSSVSFAVCPAGTCQ